MIAKLMNLDSKMLILLGVIFAAAALYVYLSNEGFNSYNSHLQYMQEKYGTSSLCDPCYDPNCTTQYPVDQADCSPSGSIPAPTYNPNDFSSYTYPTAATSSTPASSASTAPNDNTGLYERLKKDIASLISNSKNPGSDILISFAPSGGSDVSPSPTDAGAPRESVGAGAAGRLQMDRLSDPALAPASAQANSPATYQGADYTKTAPLNMNDYIRKDSIPCYACNIR